MSKIQWTEVTWNPVIGCDKVSPGCANCYAIREAHKLGENPKTPYYAGLTKLANGPQWTGVVKCLPERLSQPLKWRKPKMVFVNSMSDLFHESVPFEFIAAVYGIMAACPQHTFQVLTKRPERALEFYQWIGSQGRRDIPEYIRVPRECDQYAAKLVEPQLERLPIEHQYALANTVLAPWPLRNVWLGVSAEDQKRADERIPILLECPAAIHWVSAEPLLGRIDFSPWLGTILTDQLPDIGLAKYPVTDGLAWVVVGGESGPGARLCDIDWIDSIVTQCRAAGVPCFVKQLGSNAQYWDLADDELQRVGTRHKGGDPDEWPESLRVREWPR